MRLGDTVSFVSPGFCLMSRQWYPDVFRHCLFFLLNLYTVYKCLAANYATPAKELAERLWYIYAALT